jgi:hypothetical protein
MYCQIPLLTSSWISPSRIITMPSVGTDWVTRPFRSLGEVYIAFPGSDPCSGTELENMNHPVTCIRTRLDDVSAPTIAETTGVIFLWTVASDSAWEKNVSNDTLYTKIHPAEAGN